MNILDRYIARQFVLNFAILGAVFVALYIVGDVIIDLDEFVKGGQVQAVRALVPDAAREYGVPYDTLEPLALRGVGASQLAEALKLSPERAAALHEALKPGTYAQVVRTIWAIIDFNGPVLLLLYTYFAGLLVVGAVGFTFAHLARAGEIVAMVSSGISMYRVAMPVLIIGSLLNGLTILNQELLIPQLAAKLARSKSDLKRMYVRHEPVMFAPDGQGNLVSASDFRFRGENEDIAVLTDVVILKRDLQGRIISRVAAEQAVWDDANGRWTLIGGYVVHRPTVEDSGGLSVAQQRQEETYFVTDLTPTLLMTRRAAIFVRLLSITQLQELLAHPRVDGAELRQIMHGRLSLLVMNLLVLAMGLPFFINRLTSNFLIQSIKAAGICIGAWSSGLVMQQMSPADLNPVASAWLPVVLYLPVSAFLLQTVKT